MRCRLICLIMSSLLFAFNAHAVEVCGDLKQGEILLIKDGEKTSLLALRRDEKSPYRFGKIKFDVKQTKWDVQSIKGVSQSKVTPSKKDEAEIARERADVGKALTFKDNSRHDWQKGFILPVEGVISGHFGNQRIFNGVSKNPHTGTDIAAPEGTEVKASSSGKVLLAGGNYFYSGNMVILDHGDGLQTIYAHLKEAKVKAGDEVKQGDVIGTVGKTGRATGPHLHWGASLYNVRFRPHSLLDLNKKKCRSF
ncbi:MAG: M23 family metallopeptidase [Alphaproteobacteria bacterium]|nr:M23 family metallopeptidase [Alphaproteobacteria bacterium]